MAVSETARTWPGGTGGHKLGINYAPALLPQQIAAKKGYDQVVWLLGEDNRITEVGAMNVFAVVGRDDGGALLPLPNIQALNCGAICRLRRDDPLIGWYNPSWCNSSVVSRTPLCPPTEIRPP